MKYPGNRNKPTGDANIGFENVMKMLIYRYQDGEFQKMRTYTKVEAIVLKHIITKTNDSIDGLTAG